MYTVQCYSPYQIVNIQWNISFCNYFETSEQRCKGLRSLSFIGDTDILKTTWKDMDNLKCVLLSERSQSEKST